MQLSDDALVEFRVLWEEDHPNEELSDEELSGIALRVLRAVDAVYHPIPTHHASIEGEATSDKPSERRT